MYTNQRDTITAGVPSRDLWQVVVPEGHGGRKEGRELNATENVNKVVSQGGWADCTHTQPKHTNT